MKPPAKPLQAADYLRRSRIAFSVAVICALFITETLSAHRVSPSPASPFIWAVLGGVSLVSLGYALWCKFQQRKSQQRGAEAA